LLCPFNGGEKEGGDNFTTTQGTTGESIMAFQPEKAARTVKDSVGFAMLRERGGRGGGKKKRGARWWMGKREILKDV